MTATLEAPRLEGREAPAKSFNAELHAKAVKMKNLLGYSNTTLARKLRVSETEISKYLNRKPAGDVDKTERLLVDWIESEIREQYAPKTSTAFIEMNVSRAIFSGLDTIRETLDFGLISGPAGCKKSASANEYTKRNERTIRVEVTDDNSSRAGLGRLLLRHVSIRQATRDKLRDVVRVGRNDSVSVLELIREELRCSGWLIIVDQEIGELQDSGYRALFDLHNGAGIPVALIGNESMIEAIRGRNARQQTKNERRTSRVGFKLELDDKKDAFYTEHQLRQFVELHLKKYTGEFYKMCSRIAHQKGYLRSLRKHLLLVMRALDGYDSDVECLRDAHDLLLTESTLED